MVSLVGGSLPAHAQVTAGNAVNVVYQSEYPIGTNSAGEHRVRSVTFRFNFSLRKPDTTRIGVSLRLATTIGFHSLGTTNIDFNSVRVGSAVPGIQIWKMFGTRSIVGPYVDLGAARDLDSSTMAWVGSLGIEGEFIFPWKGIEFGLEPKLAMTGTWTASDELRTQISFGQLEFNGRYPLWFTIGSHTPDVGAFVTYREYFQNLEIDTNAGSLNVPREWGGGFTLGMFPPIRIWFVKIYRMSVGVRGGGGVSGFYLSFGERQLTRLRLP